MAEAVTRRGNAARQVMAVIDNLKALGFDHTSDTNYTKFIEKSRIASPARARLAT